MDKSKHGLTRSGRGWYKSIDGRTRWVCSAIEAPSAAVADSVFEEKFQALHNPAPRADSLSVQDFFNRYIQFRRPAVAAGNLSIRTLNDYLDTAARFIAAVGDIGLRSIGPKHFSAFVRAMQAASPARRAKLVTTIKTIFRWGERSGLLRALDFGPDLRIPRRLEFRRYKQAAGQRLYSPVEIGKLIAAADDQMFAMILLALNGGMGNKDVALIPPAAADWKAGVVRYPRAKTGIDREFPAWPQTLAALKSFGADGELIFCQPNGLPWLSESGTSHKDYLATAFARLCAAAGVPNRGFYSLRRTFRTIADAAGDQRAVAAIMGHEVGDIGSIYVQSVSKERLQKIVNFVHSALHIAAAVRQRNRARPKAAGRH